MKLRAWGMGVFMSLLAALVVSCDGDGDEDGTGSGGSGGRGGTGGAPPSGGGPSGGGTTTGGGPGSGGRPAMGGAPGSGGTGGAPGWAGAAGVGGASGLAGASGFGGAAGSSLAGGGGVAGSAGSAAGAGGETSGGSAGQGAQGGAAGQDAQGGAAGQDAQGGAAGAGPEPIRQCAEVCQADADCYVAGSDVGYVCNSATQRCENQDTCDTARDCAFAMAPVLPCSSDAQCSAPLGEVCVDAGRGRGVCATLAAAGCFLYTATLTLPRLGSEGTAEVCAQDHYECERGQCVPGCTDDDYCTRFQIGRTCNTTTHECECETDQDCDNPNLGVSRCNLVTRRCECGSDADCAIPEGDVCVAGRCSCSSDDACSTGFSGARAICR